MQAKSSIARAAERDLPELLPLVVAMHRESVFAEIALDEARLASYLGFCIREPNHVAFVHRDESGRIGGFLIGNVRPYFFSTEIGAWDDFVYVRPDLRGRLVAHRLWKAFRAWASERGARYVWMGTSAGIDPDRSHRFYTGLGLKPIGRLYRGSLV